MVTGRRLFKGEDLTDTLAAVVRDKPDLSPAPPQLRRLLEACLQKDPRERLRDIGDVWRLTDFAPTENEARTKSGARTWLWPAVAGIFSVVAAAGLWGWFRPTRSEPRPLVHFVTPAPQGIFTFPIALNPDGSIVAFVGIFDSRIFLRSMEDPVAKPVDGTEGAQFPIFSPDGKWLAFITGAGVPFELKKIPLSGGAAFTLATGLQGSLPFSWSEDGYLLLGGTSILRVPEAGGQPVEIATADTGKGELFLGGAQLLPGGDSILASVVTTSGGALNLRCVAIDAKTGQRKRVLLESVGEVRFLPTGSRPGIGHLVYGRSGSLFAATFNATTLEVGQPALVWEGIQNLGGLNPQGFSPSGTLAYPTGTGQNAPPSTFIWVDRQGTEQAVPSETQPYAFPRLSPDASRLAFHSETSEQHLNQRIWVRDFARGTTTPLTFEVNSQNPVWTPDNKWLVYTQVENYLGGTGKLAAVPTDGSGPPVLLTDEGPTPIPTSISSDGKLVVGVNGVGSEVWVLPLNLHPKASHPETAKPQPFLDNRFIRGELQFSPDGKWVAYQSNESARNEIYVVPYPGPGAKTQVSSDGGAQPRWNRNGRELFFQNGGRMMAVDVETGAAFRAGTPRMLFEKPYVAYDVHPDGKRFLMLKPASGTGVNSGELHVVLNFFDEVRRRVPLPK